MRLILSAIFALIGAPLVATALGTLAAAPPIDQRTFAMMQVIAGLLCILIAVVAAFMRPAEPVAPEPSRAPAPAPAAPAPAAPSLSLRDRLGMAVLVLGLALILIVLATWLREPGRGREAEARNPGPASGSAPPPRSPAAAVTPLGGAAEARKTSAKATSARARSARDDD
jgi:hypothetical protein